MNYECVCHYNEVDFHLNWKHLADISMAMQVIFWNAMTFCVHNELDTVCNAIFVCSV